MKVYLTESDRFCYTIYDEWEAHGEFGYTVKEDEELFKDIPIELYKEYKEVYNRFWELNKRIRSYETYKELKKINQNK